MAMGDNLLVQLASKKPLVGVDPADQSGPATSISSSSAGTNSSGKQSPLDDFVKDNSLDRDVDAASEESNTEDNTAPTDVAIDTEIDVSMPEVDKLLEEIDFAERAEGPLKDEFMGRLDIVVKELKEKGFPEDKIKAILDLLIKEYEQGNILLTNLK
jgi:hypothetical protein